jgi:hypothetical protein
MDECRDHLSARKTAGSARFTALCAARMITMMGERCVTQAVRTVVDCVSTSQPVQRVI